MKKYVNIKDYLINDAVVGIPFIMGSSGMEWVMIKIDSYQYTEGVIFDKYNSNHDVDGHHRLIHSYGNAVFQIIDYIKEQDELPNWF